MTPADIGWIISFIFWLTALIMGRMAKKNNDYESANTFWTVELVGLVAMWIFLGFTHGWW